MNNNNNTFKTKGLSYEDAKKLVLSINPNLNVSMIKPKSMVTCDYCLDRVRINVDENEKCIGDATIG